MQSRVAKNLTKHLWTVVILYTVFGLCWIFFSDALVNAIFTSRQASMVQSYKGALFILITALLLIFLIQRKNRSIAKLFKSMRQNMNSFRDTFEQSAVGIAHMTVGGEWIRVNKKLCNILNYSRKELLDIHINKIIHPDDLKAGNRKDQQLIQGELNDYVTEKRYITQSGETIYARLTKTAIRNKKGNVKYLSGILEDITKQKEAESQLMESLQEQKKLLSEIHHRVKNNLAVISGLLELQSFHAKDKIVKKILRESLMRIKSMALIHESYYKTGTLTEVSLDEYLDEFVEYIRHSFANSCPHIALEYSTERVSMNINQAIPCGLLLNELLINAYLHAFDKKEKGQISIILNQANTKVHLQVKDDGIGLPDSVNIDNPSSLGMMIVRTLVKQLNGTISVDRSNGTAFSITFLKDDRKGSASNISDHTN